MKILILGGAGMVGRKLATRLAADGTLGGKPVTALTLYDVVAPEAPAGVPFPVTCETGDLPSEGETDRLIAAMRAGVAAGGEAGPVHSAGLRLVDKVSWPVADLRCDWTDDCPIEALASLWDIYKPQLAAYVQRALDPRAAPSYGVPGDE